MSNPEKPANRSLIIPATETATADAEVQGRNLLFAIGINSYQAFPRLTNARKDVEDLGALLHERYHFDADATWLLTDEEATRKNILRTLDSLRKHATPDDRLLIYYSGHGFSDGELGFWIPVDAEEGEVATFISNAEVREIIRAIKARHILLISDSCFSGSLLVRDIGRDIGGAVKEWEKKRSRYVFCSGKGVVSDGQPGENSPFASRILEQLRENPGESLNIVRLADSVTRAVRFNYDQQAECSPLFQAGHDGGQFIFYPRMHEQDAWRQAVATATEGAFLAYLRKYPQGQFAQEADAQLAYLADDNAWKEAEAKDAAYFYLAYLRKYPKGKHADEARSRLDALEQTSAPPVMPAPPIVQSPPPALLPTPVAEKKQGLPTASPVSKPIAPTTTTTTETAPPQPANRKRYFAVGGVALVLAISVGIWKISQTTKSGVPEQATTSGIVTAASEAAAVKVDSVTTAKTATGTPTVSSPLSEDQAWKKAERLNSRAAYEEYKKAFPAGKYVLEAQKRINALINPTTTGPTINPKEPLVTPAAKETMNRLKQMLNAAAQGCQSSDYERIAISIEKAIGIPGLAQMDLQRLRSLRNLGMDEQWDSFCAQLNTYKEEVAQRISRMP